MRRIIAVLAIAAAALAACAPGTRATPGLPLASVSPSELPTASPSGLASPSSLAPSPSGLANASASPSTAP